MIIYNLMDRTPPWERTPRTPQSVKISGRVISAGSHLEFSNFPLRNVTGLINSHTISVDGLPDWYQKIGDQQREAERVKREEKVLKAKVKVEDGEDEEKWKSKKRTSRRSDD